MLLSAVILSFNAQRTLADCLSATYSAMQEAANGEPFEIFVVENGSRDNSPQILQGFVDRYPNEVKQIVLPENTGTTVSRNMALKQATGDFVLVLDADAYITASTIDELKRTLVNPLVGIAAPRLSYRDGRFQMSVDQIPTLFRKIARFLWLKRMEKGVDTSAVVSGNVDYAISACWMFRRSMLKKTGLFDEKIFYSPEDVDFCLQVWRAGYMVFYCTEASAIHDAQELSRGWKLNKFHFSHLKGLFYLMMKHRFVSRDALMSRFKER